MRTRVGYTGGTSVYPTYTSMGDHTESLQLDFDPSCISYDELLGLFWKAHRADRPARSRQYRSAVWYSNESQREAIERSRQALTLSGPVHTHIGPLGEFYRAEDYHQKYTLRRHRALVDDIGRHASDREMVDSTRAARLNGYLAGFGSHEQFQLERDLLDLSETAASLLAQAVHWSDRRRAAE